MIEGLTARRGFYRKIRNGPAYSTQPCFAESQFCDDVMSILFIMVGSKAIGSLLLRYQAQLFGICDLYMGKGYFFFQTVRKKVSKHKYIFGIWTKHRLSDILQLNECAQKISTCLQQQIFSPFSFNPLLNGSLVHLLLHLLIICSIYFLIDVCSDFHPVQSRLMFLFL